MASYWQSTRHPGPGLLFVGPLLLAYEVGVSSLGGSQAAGLRNGADVWLRDGLAALGLAHPFAAPGLVVLILAVWFWRQRDSLPDDHRYTRGGCDDPRQLPGQSNRERDGA